MSSQCLATIFMTDWWHNAGRLDSRGRASHPFRLSVPNAVHMDSQCCKSYIMTESADA